MRKEIFLVWTCLLLIGVGRVEGAAIAGGYDREESGDGSDRPTVGGHPAFATKADALLSAARTFVDAGDYPAAEKAAREVVAKYPDMVDGWLFLGYCLSLEAKYEESNKAYEKALALGADARDVYVREAFNFAKLGDGEGAREVYRRMLERDENDTEALLRLGYLEAKDGRLEKARIYYQRALDVDTGSVSIMEALAKIEEKLGFPENSKELLKRALAIEPDNVKLLKKLSFLHLEEKAYDHALPLLQKLVALQPDDQAAHRNLAVALYQRGRKVEAKVHFQKVKELGGSMKGLYGPLAECCRETGDRESALSYIKEGIAKHEQEAWLYCVWGKLLETTGDYDGAITKFTKALRSGEKPWTEYARKEISRQKQLKRRKEMLAGQRGI